VTAAEKYGYRRTGKYPPAGYDARGLAAGNLKARRPSFASAA
jgi:hypothetical protein